MYSSWDHVLLGHNYKSMAGKIRWVFLLTCYSSSIRCTLTLVFDFSGSRAHSWVEVSGFLVIIMEGHLNVPRLNFYRWYLGCS